ncbi:MAG TPA: tetratricopeptide repeat protein [Tepidisphaeraceae bacterium]|nr:tetratricopeptide repeat protein [Tepidisphaeraceae bacterium]
MTIDEVFARAVQLHQSGRFAEAEGMYRQVLAQRPSHADAIHLLGLIAHQTGRSGVAADLIEKAIAINPRAADYHINLGVVLASSGRREEAVAAYRHGLMLKPDHVDGTYNLGVTLLHLNRAEEAASAFREAITLNPRHAFAHYALGNALKLQGRLEEAVASYRQALALKPDFAEVYARLAAALGEFGRFDEAVAAYRQAISAKPDFAEAYSSMGHFLGELGRPREAEAAHRQALELRPDVGEYHGNLAIVLAQLGRSQDALQACRMAVTLKPKYAGGHNNLGNVLRMLGRAEEAVDAFRGALALRPEFTEAWNNLGNALLNMARLDEALEAYRKAMELEPRDPLLHSNVIFTMNFHPAFDAPAILQETRNWNQRHAKPLKHLIRPRANNRDPGRRLKVGYVSPDFREHVVGWNLLPLLRHHDRQQVEVFCYSSVKSPDAMTEQIRACCDQWREMIGLGDEPVAERIRQDAIDILIDLSLHTSSNRLRVFAMTPAPVQITYLAYCGTSGIDGMHYRFSDPHLDPPDVDLACYSEQTIRLPETYWCYAPGGKAPDISPLPADRNGYITFGCMNQFAKASPATVELWCEILKQVPGSRMLIHAPPGKHLQTIGNHLSRHEIASDRVQFVGSQPWDQYMASYHRIDIGLDPFPYNGGITTCDALWMGVPVVTLSGQTAVGRGGRSILTNVGLANLVALNPVEYVRLATELAGDPSRLRELRRTMRDRLTASPLMDGPRFARNVEAAYRDAWRRWCGGI